MTASLQFIAAHTSFINFNLPRRQCNLQSNDTKYTVIHSKACPRIKKAALSSPPSPYPSPSSSTTNRGGTSPSFSALRCGSSRRAHTCCAHTQPGVSADGVDPALLRATLA